MIFSAGLRFSNFIHSAEQCRTPQSSYGYLSSAKRTVERLYARSTRGNIQPQSTRRLQNFNLLASLA